MPDLTLSFMNPRLFDDVSFHPCVRFKRWEVRFLSHVVIYVKCMYFQRVDFVVYVILQGYPEIKDTNGWEGEGDHCSEGGNTVVSSILPFPFVFAFKETSGWPEVSQRRRGEKRSRCYIVAYAGIGVL